MFFKGLFSIALSLTLINTAQVALGNPSDENFEIEQEHLYSEFLNPGISAYTVGLVIESEVGPFVSREPWPDKINIYWPTRSQDVYSGYGYRSKSCGACSSNHLGIDFDHNIGTPIYSAMDGIVSRIEYGGGFGQHIYVEHIVERDGELEYWTTIYAHMKANSTPDGIQVGSAVKSGEKIGEVGNTGVSTGPHLHFEILVNGENVDPELYLKIYGY